MTGLCEFSAKQYFSREIRLRQFVPIIDLNLHVKFHNDLMTGFLGKLWSDKRTNERHGSIYNRTNLITNTK